MKQLLILLGGGVIIFCIWANQFWNSINTPPQVDIPMPALPHPNGYDYFRRAGAAYVKDIDGVDEITNGWDGISDNTYRNHKKYPLAAKKAWLKQNAKAFQLLREGLKYPALHPRTRSFSDVGPAEIEYRALGRALAVESHVRAAGGNWNGAVQSLLDDYQFGNQIARGGPLNIGLVSGDIETRSLYELSHLIPHTNAPTAKMAAAGMEKVYEQRYPFYKMLEEEKWLILDSKLQLMESPSWRTRLVQDFKLPLSDYPKIYTLSKRQLISDLTQSMNAAIDNAQRPYTQQRPIPATDDPLVALLLPGCKFLRWSCARQNVFAVEFMTMYALRAYKMDTGHYPENLKALVPTYLHKIPIDPFDGINPLHYQLQGKKYLLWSIGPDGVDNHATPIFNNLDEDAVSAQYQLLDPKSKGDVVAGISQM